MANDQPHRAGAKPQISVWSDRTALIEATAARIITLAQEAIAERGRFAWALSGGSTPRPLYELLASKRCVRALDWSKVDFFWSDERCVPPDHADSNFRLAHTALLDQLQLSAAQIRRIRGEDAPSAAATDYEQLLRAHVQSVAALDLVLLGMGPDGHTASLFPGSAALQETSHWVVPTVAPAGGQRITFTLPAINAARTVMVLVAGADKAERVRQALRDPHADLPVQHVRTAHAPVEWMLDNDAARDLA